MQLNLSIPSENFNQVRLFKPLDNNEKKLQINIDEFSSVTQEFENARRRSSTLPNKELVNLTSKINGVMKDFLKIIDEKTIQQSKGKKAFHAAYSLAGLMKSGTDLNRKIWQNLAKEVQQFCNEMVPFIFPPLFVKAALFHATQHESRNPADQVFIEFDDDSVFDTRYAHTGGGFSFYHLPDAPETILCGTISNKEFANHFNNFTLEMPKEIDQVFNVKRVDQFINSLSEFPSLQEAAFPQYSNQKSVLKMEYQRLLLEVLEVPTDRPLAISQMGTWVVAEDKPMYNLADEEFSLKEELEIAKKIRFHFELEMRYGIIFIGNHLTFEKGRVRSLLEEKFLFVRKGDKVFSHIPQFRIEFIQEPIGERFNKIKKFIEGIYSKSLTSAIFEKPIEDEHHGEQIADFLAVGIRNKLITFAQLLNLDSEVLEMIQILFENPCLISSAHPWNCFTSVSDILAYLKLRSKMKNFQDRSSIKEILSYASAINATLLNKSKLKPINLNYEQYTLGLIKMKSHLRTLIIKYLLDAFHNRQKTSYHLVIQRALDKLVDAANIIEDKETIEVLEKELNKILEDVIHNLGEINSENPTVFSEITALRAANLIGTEQEKRKVNDALHHCLHVRMMVREENLLIEKLKDRVIGKISG